MRPSHQELAITLDAAWEARSSLGPTACPPEVRVAVETVIDAKGLRQMSDSGALEAIIDEVLAANAKSVDEFRAGKDKAFNALVGEVM